MLELVYTAAPKGLISGRSGFVTVEMTEGFPPNLVSPLENLSGYKALYPPEAPEAETNPANFCYQLHGKGAATSCIVSRITYAGLSYTGRSNNLAHHLLFTRKELEALPGGPAAILACDANFPPFGQTPRLLPPRRPCTNAATPQEDAGSSAWERLCGDARWAAVLTAQFRQDRSKCAILQFTPGKHCAKEILQLIAEVTQLLTPQEAVDFTFSTYSYHSSIGNPIFLRAYPEGSPFLASIRRLNPRGVIVLGERRSPGPEELALIAPPPELQNIQPLKQPEILQSSQAVQEPAIAPAQQSQPTAAIRNEASRKSSPARHRHEPWEEEAPRGNSHATTIITAVAITLALMPVLYFVLSQCGIIGKGKGADAIGPDGPASKPDAVAVQPQEAAADDDDDAPPPAATTHATEEPPPAQAQEPPPKPSSSASSAAVTATKPADNLPADAPAATPRAPSIQERFAFFEAFNNGVKSIPLPEGMPRQGRLSVEIDAIGAIPRQELGEELLRQCLLQQDDHHLAVCPLRVIKGNGMSRNDTYELDKKSTGSQLVIRLEDGRLLIEEAASPKNSTPQRQNIQSIAIGGITLYKRDSSGEFASLQAKKHPITHEYVLKGDGTLRCTIACPKELLDNPNMILHAEIASQDGTARIMDLPVAASTTLDIVTIRGLDDREKKLNQTKENLDALDRLNHDLEVLYQSFAMDFADFKDLEKLPHISNAEKFGEELENNFTALQQALRDIIDASASKDIKKRVSDREKFVKPFSEAEQLTTTLGKSRGTLNKDDKRNDDFKAVDKVWGECYDFLSKLGEGWPRKAELLAQEGESKKSFTAANDALAEELQKFLQQDSYEKHFKACLDAQNPTAINMTKLRDELVRHYPVKVNLKGKQP